MGGREGEDAFVNDTFARLPQPAHSILKKEEEGLPKWASSLEGRDGRTRATVLTFAKFALCSLFTESKALGSYQICLSLPTAQRARRYATPPGALTALFI